MTHEQALDVLKAQKILAPTEQLYTAITIAIECMEKRKEEIKLAYDLGYTDCMYDHKRNHEQFDNSLTAPTCDGDEKP